MNVSRLRQLRELGQAVWLDDLSRRLIDDGTLERLIAQDGVSGVTSNPTIFARAIGDSGDYDAALRRLAAEANDPQEVLYALTYEDVRDAADLLRGTYERTGGRDGFVSFELPPELAHNVEGSVVEAQRFYDAIDRENVLIKVPGTEAGVEALEQLTALGCSINVTLLFALARYEQVAEAYLRGLERRVGRGEPIDRIASVASFFVSRVDAKVDQALEERDRPELKGRAGVANAKVAYEAFRRIVGGERWRALHARGANVQRPLWASTSTKNPAYPDTLYVDELIGPDTINTMPMTTLAAARDHARVQLGVTRGLERAHATLAAIRDAGVDFDDIVGRQLVTEGLDAFAASFEDVIVTVGEKLTTIAHSG